MERRARESLALRQAQQAPAPRLPDLELWREALRAVTEPFPPFSVVEELLGDSRKGEAVVLGWNAGADPSVRRRCQDSLDALSACHLVLTGAPSSSSAPQRRESLFAAEPDGHFGSEEIEALLAHIERVASVSRPFTLAVVSCGYVSRRLACCLRRHLPEDVSLLPCPPHDELRTLREEAPIFGPQILNEARRLHLLGAEIRPTSAGALDRLRPSWREPG